MIKIQDPVSHTPAKANQTSDRMRACREILFSWGANGNDPRWSSALLDDLLSNAMSDPVSSVEDFLFEFFSILGENHCDLSDPLTNLIKDVVMACFIRNRRIYEDVDWERFVATLTTNSTKAQHYFAVRAIPARFLDAEHVRSIITGLESTPYHNEAIDAFAL